MISNLRSAYLTMLAVLIVAGVLFATPNDTFAGGIEDCNSNSYDRIIRGCTRVIESGKLDNKNLTLTYMKRGIAYFRKGQYDRAISNYNRAIELNPQKASNYSIRGIAYFRKGQYDWAISDYNRATKLNPQDASAYYNRGNSYYKKGQYDRAIWDYNRATKLNPQKASTYINRGKAYEKKGDYFRAKANYEHAKKLRAVSK